MAPTAVGLIGEPLKRFRNSEWESLEKLQTYDDPPKRQALKECEQRPKSSAEFMVEFPANELACSASVGPRGSFSCTKRRAHQAWLRTEPSIIAATRGSALG